MIMKKLLIVSAFLFLLVLLIIMAWPQPKPKIDKYPKIGMNINLLTLDYADSFAPISQENLIEGLVYFLLLVDKTKKSRVVTILSSVDQLESLDLDGSGMIDLMDSSYYHLYLAWYNKKTYAVRFHALHRSGIRAIELERKNNKVISAHILMGNALKRLIKSLPVTIIYPKRISFEHAETPSR